MSVLLIVDVNAGIVCEFFSVAAIKTAPIFLVTEVEVPFRELVLSANRNTANQHQPFVNKFLNMPVDW